MTDEICEKIEFNLPNLLKSQNIDVRFLFKIFKLTNLSVQIFK